MGQFSWITSDTHEQVFNDYDKKPAYVLVPKEFQHEYGEYFEEKDYEGYGVFGGRDVYALVAQWNKPDECKNDDGTWKTDEECRRLGIDLACYDEDNASLEYPIKITSKPIPYEWVAPSESDPDQGWHDEEWDEDEDLYDWEDDEW